MNKESPAASIGDDLSEMAHPGMPAFVRISASVVEIRFPAGIFAFIMKAISRFHLCLSSAFACCLFASCDSPKSTTEVSQDVEAPASSESPAAVELFNGKNLDGWQAFLTGEGATMEDVWSVKDGILICKGEPMGYIHTTSEHTDFKLVVEWRWAPGGQPGNSGILMRVNGQPQALPRSIEVQLKSGNAGDVFGFHGMKLSGEESRMRRVENHELGGLLTGLSRSGGTEVEPGEWNTAEITLKQGELSVLLNGVEANKATGCEIVPGQIALQSEGGEIHFRRVTLTPL